jgi:hypothetical protein
MGGGGEEVRAASHILNITDRFIDGGSIGHSIGINAISLYGLLV